MKEDERALLIANSYSVLARDILNKEALQVAQILFPQDKELPSLSPVYIRENSDSYSTYADTTRRIRKYPFELQKQYFLEVWGPNGVDVGNEEALAMYLAECNSIPWFSPQEEADEITLQKLVDEYRLALNSQRLPILIVKNDWSTEVEMESEQAVEEDPAWDQFWSAAKNEKGTFDALGGGIWSSIWVTASVPASWRIKNDEGKFMGKLEGALFHSGGGIEDFDEEEKEQFGSYFAAWKAASTASAGAQYCVASDHIREHGFPTNPIVPLIEIYKLGYHPMGILEQIQDGEKRRVFGIFQPLIKAVNAGPIHEEPTRRKKEPKPVNIIITKPHRGSQRGSVTRKRLESTEEVAETVRDFLAQELDTQE